MPTFLKRKIFGDKRCVLHMLPNKIFDVYISYTTIVARYTRVLPHIKIGHLTLCVRLCCVKTTEAASLLDPYFHFTAYLHPDHAKDMSIQAKISKCRCDDNYFRRPEKFSLETPHIFVIDD